MRKILEAMIVGILFGFLTHVIEEKLPSDWQFLVDTKAIWLIPAFLIAFNLPLRRRYSDAIIVSIITLLATGITYYTNDFAIMEGRWRFASEFENFIIPAIIAGAITGYIAYLGHSATHDIIRYASVAVLPAIYTGGGVEGIISSINNFSLTPEIATELIGGLIFYILLAGKNKLKLKSTVSYIVLTIIATLGISIT